MLGDTDVSNVSQSVRQPDFLNTEQIFIICYLKNKKMPPITLRKRSSSDINSNTRVSNVTTNIWEELCERRGQECDIFRMNEYLSTPNRVRLDTNEDECDEEEDECSVLTLSPLPQISCKVGSSLLRSQGSNDLNALDSEAATSCNRGHVSCSSPFSDCDDSSDEHIMSDSDDNECRDDDPWGHFVDVVSAPVPNEDFTSCDRLGRLQRWCNPYKHQSPLYRHRLRFLTNSAKDRTSAVKPNEESDLDLVNILPFI